MVSIKEISQKHYKFSIANIIMVLITLAYILFSAIYLPKIEEESRTMFLQINILIIEMNKDESSQISESIDTFISYYNLLDSKLKKNIIMPDLKGGNTLQLKSELSNIRTLANNIKTNYAKIQSKMTKWNVILISITLLFTIIQFIQIIIWRRYQNKFLNEVSLGVKSINNTLQYKTKQKTDAPDNDFKEITELNNSLARIEKEIEFDRELLNIQIHGDLNETIKDLRNTLSKEMSCDRIEISFVNKNGQVTVETVFTTYENVLLKGGYTYDKLKTTATSPHNNKRPRIINDMDMYLSSRTPSEVEKMVYDEGIKSTLIYPIFFRNHCVGYIFISSLRKNAYNLEQLTFGKRVISLLKHKLYIEFILQDIIAQTSSAFVQLMNLKDNETALHINRMSVYSYIIAQKYSDKYKSLKPKYVREIMWFAPLHDIGKIGIPDCILLKPGKLNTEEWEIMKSHVTIGQDVIKEMSDKVSEYFTLPAMQTAVELIEGHHERFDGKGYPKGLKGKNIPLAGRIVALADVFDALTTKRPYKEAYSIEESINIMETNMLGFFDPDIFECFLESMPEIKVEYELYKET